MTAYGGVVGASAVSHRTSTDGSIVVGRGVHIEHVIADRRVEDAGGVVLERWITNSCVEDAGVAANRGVLEERLKTNSHVLMPLSL